MKLEGVESGLDDGFKLELPRKTKAKNPKLFLDTESVMQEQKSASVFTNPPLPGLNDNSTSMLQENIQTQMGSGQNELSDYRLVVPFESQEPNQPFSAETTGSQVNLNSDVNLQPAFTLHSPVPNIWQSELPKTESQAEAYAKNPLCLETLATDISAQIVVSLSIPVQRLMAPVEADKMQDYLQHRRPQEEWQILNVMCESGRHKAALVPLANRMNRFTEIKVFKHTMVYADDEATSRFEDWYMNANYIKDPYIGGDKSDFIATQGPLPNTLLNFWKMIYRENISKIFMLSCLIEGGKKKCDAYWPQSTQSSLVIENEYEITLFQEEPGTNGFYTKRFFKLKNQETGVTRTIEQYHIQGWPDHSVPNSAELAILFGLIDKLITQHDKLAQGPVLTHCSAGVGRTGTFIALYYLRKFITIQKQAGNLTPAVSIFSLVRNLKEQRYFFIRESVQYNLLYSAAAQWLKESILPNTN